MSWDVRIVIDGSNVLDSVPDDKLSEAIRQNSGCQDQVHAAYAAALDILESRAFLHPEDRRFVFQLSGHVTPKMRPPVKNAGRDTVSVTVYEEKASGATTEIDRHAALMEAEENSRNYTPPGGTDSSPTGEAAHRRPQHVIAIAPEQPPLDADVEVEYEPGDVDSPDTDEKGDGEGPLDIEDESDDIVDDES